MLPLLALPPDSFLMSESVDEPPFPWLPLSGPDPPTFSVATGASGVPDPLPFDVKTIVPPSTWTLFTGGRPELSRSSCSVDSLLGPAAPGRNELPTWSVAREAASSFDGGGAFPSTSNVPSSTRGGTGSPGNAIFPELCPGTDGEVFGPVFAGKVSGEIRRLVLPPISTGAAVAAATAGLVASATTAHAHNKSAPRRAETPLNCPALAKFARLFPGSTRNPTISVIFGRRTGNPVQEQEESSNRLQSNRN